MKGKVIGQAIGALTIMCIMILMVIFTPYELCIKIFLVFVIGYQINANHILDDIKEKLEDSNDR